MSFLTTTSFENFGESNNIEATLGSIYDLNNTSGFSTINVYIVPPTGGTVIFKISYDGVNFQKISMLDTRRQSTIRIVDQATILSSAITGARIIRFEVIQAGSSAGSIIGRMTMQVADINGTNSNNVTTVIMEPSTVFGELSVAELTPVLNINFSTGEIDSSALRFGSRGTSNGADVLIKPSDNHITLITGTDTNGESYLITRNVFRYSPGQGVMARFTNKFSSPRANSRQIIGIGSPNNGFFFGYNGSDFGIMRRYGGKEHIVTFELTGAASSSGNVTITLNNVDTTIALTSATIAENATEIVTSVNWVDVGTGWETIQNGNLVVFRSINAEPLTGTYSYTDNDSTGVTISITENVVGLVSSDYWVYQSDWSLDTGLGSDILPSLNFTKGNVFQIEYQWLGYGDYKFSIENPITGRFIRLHVPEYANSATTTSIFNPNQPFYIEVKNSGNNTSLEMACPSIGGFSEGPTKTAGITRSVSITQSTSTSLTHLLSIMIPIYKNQYIVNRKIKLIAISFGNDARKSCIIKLIKNPNITGSLSWTATSENSIVQQSNGTVTNLIGGEMIQSYIVGGGQGRDVNLNSYLLELLSGDVLTITGQLTSGSADDVVVSITWREDL